MDGVAWRWGVSQIGTQARLQNWDSFPRPGVPMAPREGPARCPQLAGLPAQLLPRTGSLCLSLILSSFLPGLSLWQGWGGAPAFLFLCSGEMMTLPVPVAALALFFSFKGRLSVGPCSSSRAGSSWCPRSRAVPAGILHAAPEGTVPAAEGFSDPRCAQR